MKIVLFLLLACAAGAETLSPELKSVRMFHDDNGRPGAEAQRSFATTAGRIHIAAELASPRSGTAEVGWTVYQLTASGEGVPLMDRSAPATNFDRVSFSCVRTPDWKPGRYRIDLALDGKVVQATEFTVVKDAANVQVLTVGLHACDATGQVGPAVTWFRGTERRLWLRMVAKGCGGLPLRATLTPLAGDGAPVATYEDAGPPETAKLIDISFDTPTEWAAGAYRAEISAGGHTVSMLDFKIE